MVGTKLQIVKLTFESLLFIYLFIYIFAIKRNTSAKVIDGGRWTVAATIPQKKKKKNTEKEKESTCTSCHTVIYLFYFI